MSDRSETKAPADEGRLDRRVRPVAEVRSARLRWHLPTPDADPVKQFLDNDTHLLYALTDDEVRILNKAKSDAAWRARRLDLCKCDRIEYCRHCYPPEFREGGEWHGA